MFDFIVGHKVGFYALLFVVFSLFCQNLFAQSSSLSERYPIIPYPVKLIPEAGAFTFNAKTTIQVENKLFEKDALDLIALMKRVGGITLQKKHAQTTNCILLKEDTSISNPEGYSLSINPSKIILSARTSAGLFWGIETIRQLLFPAIERKGQHEQSLTIPSVNIVDYPAFAWRGMHLDVVRHFFSETYLKKFIDRMALYKLNKLHLHLTDDEGWRIQIKKYPELTKQGAWRTFDAHDSACMQLSKDNPDFKIDSSHIIHRDGKTLYGGYYTQKQMKDIIRYAAARHIEIIPELDMPGHMMAVIKIFPYLSCTGKAGHGQVFSEPLCPCKKSTFQFAENVYKEIFALFPSKYVHIGGDEVDKTTWKECPACKTLMQKEGLTNVDQLQSCFVKHMERFFYAHGKQIIGWDDIMEGGIDSSAVIMYWRSWLPKAHVKAANNENKVIMAPGNPLYFDAFPDKNSLSNVYHFNPYPEGLTERGKQKIIGIEACVWTERIPSEKRADFMTMPRMTAMAEVAWKNNPKDYKSYLERLQSHYSLWDQMHIHYRLPDLSGFADDNVFIDSTKLKVQKPWSSLSVHYTMDDSIPTLQSRLLPKELTIDQSSIIRLAAFSPGGNRGDIYTVKFKKENYLPPFSGNRTFNNGLQCFYYVGKFDSTTNLSHLKPERSFAVSSLQVPSDINAPAFGLKFRGYFNIPATDIYRFELTSDDGSVLKIDEKTVVNNDGLHSALEKSGEIALQRGVHRFSLDFIEGGGGYTLQLKYGRQGELLHDLPDSLLEY
ncbi:MAG: family 20 glycosylhydrolase [Microbacter sp.]